MSKNSVFPYISTFMLRNGATLNKPFMTGAEFDKFNSDPSIAWAVLIEYDTGVVVASYSNAE